MKSFVSLLLFIGAMFAQTVNSVSPNSGSGSDPTFTIQFTQNSPSQGYYDLYLTPYGPHPASNTFPNSCVVAYNAQTDQWSLANDQWTQKIFPDSTGMAANSQCVFFIKGSGVNINGTTVTMQVAVEFTTAMDGQTINILGWTGTINSSCSTYPSAGCSGIQQMGKWTVQAPSDSMPALYVPIPPGYGPVPATFGPDGQYPAEDFFLAPGTDDQLAGCLRHLDGTPDNRTGVQVKWTTAWTANSGGHAHPDGAAPGSVSFTGGRPGVCITALGVVCTAYQDTITTSTINGCSGINVRMPWYSGEYFVVATPQDPNTLGFNVDYEVFTAGLGIPTAAGKFTFWPDNAHPDNKSGLLRTYRKLTNGSATFYRDTGYYLTVYRVANFEGGFLDTFSYWLPYPSVTEMHADGTAYDALAPATAKLQATALVSMVAGGCIATPFTPEAGLLLFHGDCR